MKGKDSSDECSDERRHLRATNDVKYAGCYWRETFLEGGEVLPFIFEEIWAYVYTWRKEPIKRNKLKTKLSAIHEN